MDGSNFPPAILSIEDARAYAAAIADERTAQVAIANQYAPMLDDLTEKLAECRSERDALMNPLAEREKALRADLYRWIKDDPDQQLKDVTGRVVATLAKAKGDLVINPTLLPSKFLKPDEAAIRAALKIEGKVPGVTETKNYTLVVK